MNAVDEQIDAEAHVARALPRLDGFELLVFQMVMDGRSTAGIAKLMGLPRSEILATTIRILGALRGNW